MKVQADDSFRCASLPSARGSLVGGCKGWTNVIGENSATESLFTTKYGERQESATAEVMMKANGAWRVVVLCPGGSPLVGATVSMAPNQRLPSRGNSLLGVDNYSKAALDKLKEVNAENKTLKV